MRTGAKIEKVRGSLEGLDEGDLLIRLREVFEKQPQEKKEIPEYYTRVENRHRQQGFMAEYLLERGILTRVKTEEYGKIFVYQCTTPGHGKFPKGQFKVHMRHWHPDEYQRAREYANRMLE